MKKHVEKKTSAILITCIVIGAFGLTFAYLSITQPESMNPIFLLLIPPKDNISPWTWVSGSDSGNQLGTYGTKGVGDASNVPGARRSSISWTDSEDNLWLFGGEGYNDVSYGKLNDLWKFNITSGLWTWVSGTNLLEQLGTYGEQNVFEASNVPGARSRSISWIDSYNNLWLFGGEGYNDVSYGYLNDLWKF
ncbi:MAG: Kelch repeat-containing protein, partial [Promethearchaeota archaeon]